MKTNSIAKQLIIMLCVWCFLGCDRSNTEPELVRGCFEVSPSTTLDENLTFVALPDSLVERQLIRQGHDTDGLVNGRISTKDVKMIRQFSTSNANVYENPEYSVRNFKGIEYFSNLESFGSNYDLVDSVDLTFNTKLKTVGIWSDVGGAGTGPSFSQRLKTRTLRYINLGKNENLKELSILNSIIKELDVSGLPNLETLVLSGDSLKTIYISHAGQIKPGWKIYCSGCSETVENLLVNSVEYKICNRN